MFLFYQQPKQLYSTTSVEHLINQQIFRGPRRANMRLPWFETLRSTEPVTAQYCIVRYIYLLLFRKCVHCEGGAYEACDLQWVWNNVEDNQ